MEVQSREGTRQAVICVVLNQREVAFMEIYNEQIRDLLAACRKPAVADSFQMFFVLLMMPLCKSLWHPEVS